jgi:transposase-like protein
MTQSKMYKRHGFPPEIIQYAVWLYHRFNLSRRDVEDWIAQRGITVSYEAIRLWCNKFGSIYAQRLRRKHQGYGDTFFSDEVFIKIQGKQHYLWRAVDKMVKQLMYSCRNGVSGRPQNDSLSGYCTNIKASRVRLSLTN